ncbi:MAG TPA: LLM class F420-dependent oxidoreductase [Nocardioides sp.]|uniref:LLM class F420-dependent oxidoreductase n=1 Tax=Nocardioides sp. TaxID=35761 RepID=UPI002F3EF8B4
MELRIFLEPQQGATYDDQLTIARLAEGLGFGAFFRSDHYLAMGVDGHPGPTDSWVTLAGIARETDTIRLGTLLTSATFRYPGPLAISVAQVDQMSGGRVEIGVGAGWYDAEHAAYAIPFPPAPERFDNLEDTLAILTGLWGTPDGETFSYAGSRHSVTDSPGLPKPFQQPHPPIIVGGKGAKRTPALAARFADEFNLPFVGLDESERQIARVRAACEEIDRDPDALVYSSAHTVCVGPDEAEVRRRADSIGRTPEDLRANAVAGTPQEVVDTIGQYAALGATRMYLQVLDIHDLEQIHLIASEVMPHV